MKPIEGTDEQMPNAMDDPSQTHPCTLCGKHPLDGDATLPSCTYGCRLAGSKDTSSVYHQANIPLVVVEEDA